MSAPSWHWSKSATEATLSDNRLTITDSSQGKAWTSSVQDNPVPTGLNYYEIKVESCSASNSIKIVFGIIDQSYLDKTLKITRGAMGSLRGGCPIGYFKEFGIGALCYYASGTISKDGNPVCKGETYTTNDLIGILVDSNTKSIAFFKNKHLQYSILDVDILNNKTSDSPPSNTNSNNNVYVVCSLIKENSITIIENPELPKFSFNTTTSSTITTTVPTPYLPTPQTSVNKPSETTSPNNNTTTTTTTTNNNTPTPIPTTAAVTVTSPPTTTPPTTTTTEQNENIKNGNATKSTSTLSSSGDGNTCPICFVPLRLFGNDLSAVNQHIDECLTLSLLDNENGVKPFKVDCPYLNCKKSILSKDFVAHCNESHFLEISHEYKCPLCKEKPKNLISHLSKSHISLPSLKKQSFIGLGYSTSVLENDLDSSNECAICLEEFLEGQTVARLECLCIFHIHCMEFFLKTKKCPVHH